MPAARTGVAASALHDVYLSNLLKWSDIQEYLPYLHKTAKSYDKVRILELGARTGNSTSAFIAAAEAVGGHVTSVDISKVTDFPEMKPFEGCSYWTFIHGPDMDEDVQAKLPLEVDVLFIDTSHEYEHTIAELRAYMPRVTRGGVALFHDTNLVGWGGNPPEEGKPEVRQALDTYCKESGSTWKNLPGRYGLGKIQA